MKEKPLTEILINYEEIQRVEDFAATLETIAKKLREEQKFTFVQGEEQIEVAPSAKVEAEYKYAIKGDKHSFEIEFEWYAGDKAAKSMKIE
ncbi:amphi-Trp domain-containing protein [Evansella sp. LMS18]|uniref:amphi-Trp domain-containing protein n=1 Tax=Evansella sp. LMS18 TaxID=2924033 RepID=UPI0020D1423E|nr:amphi-Trp domain-containing protein [Evansella sp. LMS18]UTR10116.1 amphi-Trp domain-containing protein [Evansella sp. LMS18]